MAVSTRLEHDAPPLRTLAVERLENLAGVLTARGLEANVMAPVGRVPRLQIAVPRGPQAGGDVYASRCQDGTWWFWWAWAERIAATAELQAAADRIEQALRAMLPGAGAAQEEDGGGEALP